MLDCYSDDIVVHYGGTSPFAGTHHGRDRLVQLLVETAQRSGRELVTIDQVDDHDSHGALFVTETMRIEGDVVGVARALRYRTLGDRISECWLYEQDQQLVDQAWSSPLEETPTSGSV